MDITAAKEGGHSPAVRWSSHATSNTNRGDTHGNKRHSARAGDWLGAGSSRCVRHRHTHAAVPREPDGVARASSCEPHVRTDITPTSRAGTEADRAIAEAGNDTADKQRVSDALTQNGSAGMSACLPLVDIRSFAKDVWPEVEPGDCAISGALDIDAPPRCYRADVGAPLPDHALRHFYGPRK
jgi:hypothetical protein